MKGLVGFPPIRRGSVAGLSLLLLVALAAAGCESARQPVPRSPLARHVVRQEGRVLVERACAAHGGLERWQKTADATFTFADTWSGLAGRVVRPWSVPTAKGQFQMLLHSGYARLQITDKQGPITYGYGKDGAWVLRGARASQDGGDLSTARTTLPAYVFAFQFPFTFLVDDAVLHYMGIQPAPPGGPVHEVLVTYPWYTGDRARDWYVARFDTTTMRLRSVTYTRSYWGPATFEYTDEVGGYQQVDSLWIPTQHAVRMTWPFRPDLHKWTVTDIRFNQGLTDSLFLGPAPLGGR